MLKEEQVVYIPRPSRGRSRRDAEIAQDGLPRPLPRPLASVSGSSPFELAFCATAHTLNRRLIPNGTSPVMPLKEDGSRNIDTAWDQAKTWAQMEAVLASGKVKAIGVSNFSELLLDQLSKTWKTVPAVNQVSGELPYRHTR